MWGGAKLPQAEQIEYGELALNYAKGYESISLKNNQDEIVTINVGAIDELSASVRNNYATSANTHNAIKDVGSQVTSINSTLTAFSSSVVTEISNAGGGGVGMAYPGTISGEVFNDYINCEAIGPYSHAEGQNTIAIGSSSHAECCSTIASGNFSHAEGYYTSANDYYSHAEGCRTLADGWDAHAEGDGSTAIEIASHAEGYRTISMGGHSHSEGTSTSAIGIASHAEGRFTISIGYGSHSEGVNSTASGDAAHSEGCGTIAHGLYPHAEGYSTTASGEASHAEGKKSEANNTASHAEGFSTTANGEASHAEGWKTIASGNYSHAEGYGTNANGIASHSEGQQNTARGVASHTEGSGTTGYGAYSHAEGHSTIASGESSHAEGYAAAAKGDQSHAEGYMTTAEGVASHAEGSDARALGNQSHAEGITTLAEGIASHAEGTNTAALGASSHAEGDSTITNGTYSHAEGQSTIAEHTAEHACGQYNVSHDNSIFSIGIGTGISDRKNAIAALTNGNVFVNGIGEYDGTSTTGTYTLQNAINSSNRYLYPGSNGEVTYCPEGDGLIWVRLSYATYKSNISVGGHTGALYICSMANGGSYSPCEVNGINMDAIVPAYWDDSQGTWIAGANPLVFAFAGTSTGMRYMVRQWLDGWMETYITISNLNGQGITRSWPYRYANVSDMMVVTSTNNVNSSALVVSYDNTSFVINNISPSYTLSIFVAGRG